MERDGIEPLGATPLNMPTGLQPAMGNTLQFVNTLFRKCLLKQTGGIEPLRLLYYVRKRMPTEVPVCFNN